jgi:hypothetical protein
MIILYHKYYGNSLYELKRVVIVRTVNDYVIMVI